MVMIFEVRYEWFILVELWLTDTPYYRKDLPARSHSVIVYPRQLQ